MKSIDRTILALCLLLLTVAMPVAADPLSELLTGTPAAEDPAPDKVISATSSPEDDKRIRRRLGQIFSELEALRDIAVGVSNGIVTLEGPIDSKQTGEKAVQLARQVDGVVEVQDRLIVDQDVEKRLRATQEKLLALGKDLAAGLPLSLLALLIFGLFWLLGSWLSRRQRFFLRFAPNAFIASLLGQVAHFVLIALGLILALVLLDATALIGTILGAAGIIGLAFGFAVRDTVENYVASILLSLRNPFEVNDLVIIEGYEGHIVRLTSRATILISPDGNHIRIPNAVVFKAVITNFTRHPERRFEFDLTVAGEHDLVGVRAHALRAVTAVPGVLEAPSALVLIQDMIGRNATLRVFAWVDQRSHDFGKVRGEAIRAVKVALDEAGVGMAEPGYRVRLVQREGDAGGQVEDLPTTIETPIETRAGAASSKTPAVEIPERVQDQAQDLSADRTIEDKVASEQGSDQQNLLDSSASKEL
jgi:small-conductance mechanosensitive channel